MADFPAVDQTAAQVCVERVQGCDVYVGVLGTRYGSPVADIPEMSYAELEFDTATQAGLDRLVFLLDTDAADVGIPLSVLIDREFGGRQEAFRSRVRCSGLVTGSFANPAALGQLAERSLRYLKGVRRSRIGGKTHAMDVQVDDHNTRNSGRAEVGRAVGGRPPADNTWAVAVCGEEHSGAGALGAGVVIGARQVLTCSRVCAGLINEDGGPQGPLWVRFSKASLPAPGPLSRRVIGVQMPEGGHDLAVLLLEGAVPAGVRAARLRRPVPEDLAGLGWWAFGFPEGQRLGDEAYGTVGTPAGEGFVRLEARSSCKAGTGFSGSGLWSPDYEAVVGIVGAALTRDGDTGGDHTGGALAITLVRADQWFGGAGLAGAGGWSAEQAGEVAMSSWGWALQDDPEYGPHWRPRARGFDDRAEGGDWFRGRRAALTEITGWLSRDRADRRALVVTGSPGVGKSAVLGRVVTTADPGIRAELPVRDDSVWAAEGSVSCAVHAKGKTALEVATEIARAASARLPDKPLDLAPAVRAALAVRGTGRFNVIIDALDEAVNPDEARLTARQVVLPLLQQCAGAGVQVVIGTRRRDHDGDLISPFGDARFLIDLDVDRYFKLEDLEAYALATLQQSGSERPGNPYASQEVARPLAARIAEISGRNFLVAYLTALTHGSFDNKPADLEELIYTPDLREVLRGFLGRFQQVDGIPLSATKLLTALAYAEAPGLPIELWITAIEAIYGVRPADIELDEFTQSAAANFLVESSQDSEPVFRLYHQALNDTLLKDRASRAVKDQRALTRAFLAYGRRVGWASAPPYLLGSLSHHAERAGMLDELLTDDAYLLHADLRRLTTQAARATTAVGRQRAQLLRLTPYVAATEDPPERRALFSVTEALEKFGNSFRDDPGPAPYRARWSAVSTHAERAAQEGHTGGVAVLCSLVLDGRTLLVSGGEDEMARIWDPATGRRLRVLEGHAGQVIGVHGFAAEDGRILLASAGTDGTARIWDPATGDQLHVLEGHVGTVMAVHGFTAGDGRTVLASAGADAVVGIWDPVTGEQLDTLNGHAGTVHALCAFTSGGRKLLACACGDGRILVWDPVSGELSKTLERRAGDKETDAVRWVCAFTAVDGRTLLASASAGTVWVWDPESVQYQELNGTASAGGAWEICAFTADDGRPLLATAGSDEMVRIWDPATWRQLRELEAHHDEAYSVCAFTVGDGHTLLASSGDESTVRVWDPATGEQRGAMQGTAGSPWSVCAFTVGDGQVLLATAGDEATVRVWDLATGEQQHALAGAVGAAWSVCAFPAGDGRMLLAGGGNEVRIWDPATGQLLRALEGGTGRVISVCALASQGRALLASGGADTVVRIWDPAAGKLLRTLEGHTGKIWDMCALVTADGKALLASADDEGTVLVWDPSTGEQQRALDAVSGEVWSVCAFPAEDQRALLALAEGDGNIRVYDLATGELQRTLSGHTTGVESVCAFTSGRRTLLASCASDDTEMRIWDPATGQMLQVIPVHITPKTVVAVDDILVLVLSAGLLTIKLDLEGPSRP
jgi:WD40 repeat protein